MTKYATPELEIGTSSNLLSEGDNRERPVIIPPYLDNVMNLAEALPQEQSRVRGLVLMYRDPLLKGAGEFAARMMEESLRIADQAVMSGDVTAMLRSYADLKAYEA